LQKRSEETRSRILAAAVECFSRDGYEATGVAEICKRAGVSKGAFYHHFATKQAVFLEILNEWLGNLDAQLTAIHLRAHDVPDALLEMAAMIRPIFETAIGRLPMFLEFWLHASRDPQIWQATITPYRHYRKYFANLLRQGIAEGSLRPMDVEVGAQAVVSMAVGIFLQGVLDPQGADWSQSTQDSIRILIEGMRRR
jgi:TetR/AcrR family transcriptional repressor of uid operon